MTSNDPRFDEVEKTLKQHSTAIYELQEGQRRLEAGQERQSVAIQTLTENFGQVLGELGKVSEEVRKSKTETLAAVHNVTNKVTELHSNQSAFRTEWKGICSERHNMVDFRLARMESEHQQVLKEIDDMSDESKIHYIHNLQAQLAEHAKRQIEKEKQEHEDIRQDKGQKHATKLAWLKLLGIGIGALLTGTGGTVLIQWLLS